LFLVILNKKKPSVSFASSQFSFRPPPLATQNLNSSQTAQPKMVRPKVQ
jgi:hypothetical protein